MRIKPALRIFGVILFSQLFLFPGLSKAQEILVIVNKNVTDSIDLNKISSIYRAEKTKWNDGTQITVTMLTKGDLHEAFAKSVVGLNTNRWIRIWRRIIFTGSGLPPRTFKTETDMVNFIAATPGAMGYITASTPHENVKVIYDNRKKD